jgi:hypothetical protein
VFNGSRGTLGGLGSSMLTGGVVSGAMYGVSNFGMNRPTPTTNVQQTTDLYRAIGTREYNSITTHQAFLPGGNSLSAREFAFSYSEAQKYANWDTSKIGIVRTSVPTKTLSNFEISHTIDPSIFTKGVLIVQPEMNEYFNSVIIGLKFYIGG